MFTRCYSPGLTTRAYAKKYVSKSNGKKIFCVTIKWPANDCKREERKTKPILMGNDKGWKLKLRIDSVLKRRCKSEPLNNKQFRSI